MSESTSTFVSYRVAAATAAAAAVLVSLEVLRTMRGALWIGFELRDSVPLLATWTIYAAVLGTAALIFNPLTGPIRLSIRQRICLPFIYAAALWLGLALAARSMGWGGVLAGIGVLAIAAAYLYLLTRKTPSLILRGAISLVIACLVGVAVAAMLHDRFLLHPEMRPLATPAALAASALLLGCATAFIHRFPNPIPAALLALVVCGIHHGRPTAEAGQGSPNLLLITSDTLRADFCSVYGGPVPTPNMERLAGQGACFEQSVALAPWTLPSMIGLMASTYPPSPSPERSIEERREEVGRYRFPESTPTLAELLKRQGYRTAAFVANTLLDDTEGLLRGFDTHVVVGHRTHVQTGFFELTPLLQQALRYPFPQLVRPRPVDTTRILTAYARKFLRAQHGPWFLWMHYMDPHTAYDPPDQYRTVSGPWPVFCNADPYWGVKEFDEHGTVLVEPQYRPDVKRLYEGEVRYIDDALGALTAELDDIGARDTTFTAFTSDHGEEFWDHGQYGHGHSLYNELLHVPLLIVGPDVRPQRIAAPFSAVHVIPTLAEFLGVAAYEGWRGASAAGNLLQGTPPAVMPIFSQATHPSLTDQPWQAVRHGEWKLIRGMRTGEASLYNVSHDPAERTNLIDAEPTKVGELMRALDNWQKSFPRTLSSPAADSPDSSRQKELLNRLQNLGYL